jgi:quercetin dioxygenase-like cupin family protein
MRKIIATLAVSLLVGTPLLAQSSGTPQPAGKRETGHPSAPHALSANYENLKWQTMVAELGAASPQVSILRVDPTTQATQLLIRVPKRMHVPMHWHSANETHTVIQGTWVFEHEGARDQLGPGGFNYIPAKMQHQAWASDDALVFITVDSAWDVNWVSGPPTKADLGKTPTGR